MSDIGPVTAASRLSALEVEGARPAVDKGRDSGQLSRPTVEAKADEQDVVAAASDVEALINSVSETSLSFSVDKDLSRMVVAVRAVGSDEIIRQFPPEEFMTVAKFIAAQDPESLNEDFLKGILFDQYT